MTKSGKHGGKGRNCTCCAISSFGTMFSKRCLLQRRQKASIWGKGLNVWYTQRSYCKLLLFLKNSLDQYQTEEGGPKNQWQYHKQYIEKYFYNNPSMYKFISLLKSTHIKRLNNLALILHQINLKTQTRLMDHSYEY